MGKRRVRQDLKLEELTFTMENPQMMAIFQGCPECFGHADYSARSRYVSCVCRLCTSSLKPFSN